jgi:hypothetical protein
LSKFFEQSLSGDGVNSTDRDACMDDDELTNLRIGDTCHVTDSPDTIKRDGCTAEDRIMIQPLDDLPWNS